MADEPLFDSRSRITYRADNGTTIVIEVPWREVDIIPPPSIPFVDSITKRTIVYSYEATNA